MLDEVEKRISSLLAIISSAFFVFTTIFLWREYPVLSALIWGFVVGTTFWRMNEN